MLAHSNETVGLFRVDCVDVKNYYLFTLVNLLEILKLRQDNEVKINTQMISR